MEIKTTEQITMALLKGVPELAEKKGIKRGNQLYKDLIKMKWVAVDDIILDLKGWLEAVDYSELKQCVSDFIKRVR